MPFWLIYFSPKSFSFFCIRLFVYFSVISKLLIEFSFIDLFCLYCFTFCRYLSNLPSFASTFWFISSSCIVSFSSVFFSFLCLIIPLSFLCIIILPWFCRFFKIFFCSRNFHPGFDFSFVLFEGFLFSRKLISILDKLVHLIRFYYSLIYMSVLDSPIPSCFLHQRQYQVFH